MWSNVEMNFIQLSAMLISAKKIPKPSRSPHLPPFICYTPLSPRTYILMSNPFYLIFLYPLKTSLSQMFFVLQGVQKEISGLNGINYDRE